MQEIKLKNTIELDVKRFYLPLKIERKCPNCGNNCQHNFNQNYLSYPELNKKMDIAFYCNKCDQEFEIDLTLNITLCAGIEIRKL